MSDLTRTNQSRRGGERGYLYPDCYARKTTGRGTREQSTDGRTVRTISLAVNTTEPARQRGRHFPFVSSSRGKKGRDSGGEEETKRALML